MYINKVNKHESYFKHDNIFMCVAYSSNATYCSIYLLLIIHDNTYTYRTTCTLKCRKINDTHMPSSWCWTYIPYIVIVGYLTNKWCIIKVCCIFCIIKYFLIIVVLWLFLPCVYISWWFGDIVYRIILCSSCLVADFMGSTASFHFGFGILRFSIDIWRLVQTCSINTIACFWCRAVYYALLPETIG